MEFDVVIVGAGIIGACVARELSRTNARVCLLDKENDVSCGTSKANSGIVHAGYDPVPGSLMAKFNVQGAKMYPELAKKLQFDYRDIGSLVLAFDESGLEKIKALFERGKQNGVERLKLLSKEEVLEMEPNVSEEVKGALLAETAAVISPYQTTWAFAESAVINGVTFMRETMVHGIEKTGGEFVLDTSKGKISTKFVVNAAGLFADRISSMAGAREFRIVQRRGEYCLLDNKCRGMVNHVLFQTPTSLGKGVLVTQTVDGNILIGPSAEDADEKMYGYLGTTSMSQEKILQMAAVTTPEIPRRNIINSFCGIRALAFEKDSGGEYRNIDDFIIEEDAVVKGFVNVAGICSPGLTSAPAIGIEVARILREAGLNAKDKDNFIEQRNSIPSFKESSNEEKQALIQKDNRYGQIICRCEMITEGEIVAAIKSPLGAVDLDGVKRRTRAGMGRCQAGFCSPRVTEIISRELRIPMVNVTKKGGTSYILEGKTRATVSDIAE